MSNDTTAMVAYEPQGQLVRTDSWTEVLGAVGELARSIAETDFVPDAMKGKPAAVAAAILTGREIGVPPMTSLANIQVIKGKPGLSPLLMRQLILSAGHQLRYTDTSDSRCVVEGRRRGEQEWTRVTFTADQAKRARIDLGGYPEDKLVARATARLARRAFADCLGGVPYLAEELAEGQGSDGTPTAAQGLAPKTAQRRRKPKPAPVEADEAPPLPDAEPDAPVEGAAAVDLASGAQLQALAAAMTGIGYRSRGDQHSLVARLLGRPIASAREVTAQEAHGLLDDFGQAESSGDPQGYIDDLLGTVPAEVVEPPLTGETDQ